MYECMLVCIHAFMCAYFHKCFCVYAFCVYACTKQFIFIKYHPPQKLKKLIIL